MEVNKVAVNVWMVEDDITEEVFYVWYHEKGWVCSCSKYQRNPRICLHIKEVLKYEREKESRIG